MFLNPQYRHYVRSFSLSLCLPLKHKYSCTNVKPEKIFGLSSLTLWGSNVCILTLNTDNIFELFPVNISLVKAQKINVLNLNTNNILGHYSLSLWSKCYVFKNLTQKISSGIYLTHPLFLVTTYKINGIKSILTIYSCLFPLHYDVKFYVLKQLAKTVYSGQSLSLSLSLVTTYKNRVPKVNRENIRAFYILLGN